MTSRRSPRDQDGVAMITVMMIVVVLSLLMVAALGYAVQSEPSARRDQDWNAALAAAQAGVDDYLYRLQQNDNYYLYSATNPPTPANAAFTGWQTIPGPANDGQFHYSVDLARYASQGILQLTSTGRVEGVQRTVRANLRRRNYLDYLYLTDYESLDPQSGFYSDPATATAECDRYWWQGRPDGSPGFACVRIFFTSGDTINGPLHSNDTISINGSPTFNDKVTTGFSGATCPPDASYNYHWQGRSSCGGDTPQFQPGDPEAVSLLTLPASNTAIKAETNRAAGKTGCLYTGPTRIELLSSGRMNVTSPFTTSPTYASCVGANVVLPTNGVIYAQNVPSAQVRRARPARTRSATRSPATSPPTSAGSATSSCPAPSRAGSRSRPRTTSSSWPTPRMRPAAPGRATCSASSPTSSCRSTTRSTGAGTTLPTAATRPRSSRTRGSTRPSWPSATRSSSRTTTEGRLWGRSASPAGSPRSGADRSAPSAAVAPGT